MTNSSGPNVSVLHLRNTSEPWPLICDQSDIERNLRFIFDMDDEDIYRNISDLQNQLRLLSARPSSIGMKIQKQPLPLPRTVITNRNGNVVHLRSENRTRSPSLILKPPRKFKDFEYESDSSSVDFSPRKEPYTDRSDESLLRYPILSPPPGFQDEKPIYKSRSRSCPISNPKMEHRRRKTKADYTDRSRSHSSSYTPELHNSHSSNYKKFPVHPDYPEYVNGCRMETGYYPDQKNVWLDENTGYNCRCNHCRSGPVPSSLTYFGSLPNTKNFEYQHEKRRNVDNYRDYRCCEVPNLKVNRRSNIRRATSFQVQGTKPLLNGFHGSEEFHMNSGYDWGVQQQLKNGYSVEDQWQFGSGYPYSGQSYVYPYPGYSNSVDRLREHPSRSHMDRYTNDFMKQEQKEIPAYSTVTKVRSEGSEKKCKCCKPNNQPKKNPIYETPNNFSCPEPSRAESRRSTNSSIESRIYEEIGPYRRAEFVPETNSTDGQSIQPDIAITNSPPNKQIHYDYDPEFLKTQPDVLQSAIIGHTYQPNRNTASSPTEEGGFKNWLISCTPLTNKNYYLEEVTRKSYSLPKSFAEDRYRRDFKLRDNPALLFHWRKHGIKGLLFSKKVIIPTSVMSETAPTTPVRDIPEKKKYGRLMKIGQYSSTPSLDDNSTKHINFDCDNNRYRKDKFKATKTATLNSSDYHRLSSQENILSGSNVGDGVFHKFCKSFSLRFLKKTHDNDEDEQKDASSQIPESNNHQKKQSHRFGPLPWRSSKERKGKLELEKSDEIENKSNINSDVMDKASTQVPKQDCPQRLVRRTLSDLNGYGNIVKDKTVSSLVPIKYRPAVPVLVKKHKQYDLRRTVSQPLLSSKFSPAQEKKQFNTKAFFSEDERVVFSEDDMMSDSGSSLHSRKNSLEQGLNDDVVIFAEAVWDHVAIESELLPFRAGDVIEVYNVLDRDWWWGMCDGKTGWFPSDFVRLRVNQEGSIQTHIATSPSKPRILMPMYSNDQVRSKIIGELINTERDFVKVLKDVQQAFIEKCKNEKELFTTEQIYKIFGNWEDILSFQLTFLNELELSLDKEAPHRTCVGIWFIQHQENFYIYSDYCNNHPLSIATLQQLYVKPEYRNFFEKCRTDENLIEIPLDGFLLTPIQRICKYPLQLAELLKYTETDHMDYKYVKDALNAMRDVAVLINERKRRMESLEKLILWQNRVEGWEGKNLVEESSQLIHQNDVTKVFAGMWSTNVTLFLFDHQLFFCKKDILKRDHYIYKGRIALDDCEIIDIRDGKDSILGINIRHGIKIQNIKLNKWLLFCCRTNKEKREWLEAFDNEKRLVRQDEQKKLQISPMDRRLAYITATTCSSRPAFLKHRNKKLKRTLNSNGQYSRNTSSHILGRKVGTWFMFGANRKNLRRIVQRPTAAT